MYWKKNTHVHSRVLLFRFWGRGIYLYFCSVAILMKMLPLQNIFALKGSLYCFQCGFFPPMKIVKIICSIILWHHFVFWKWHHFVFWNMNIIYKYNFNNKSNLEPLHLQLDWNCQIFCFNSWDAPWNVSVSTFQESDVLVSYPFVILITWSTISIKRKLLKGRGESNSILYNMILSVEKNNLIQDN